MKRATIYSIAQEVGVSASTVSRAFSRPQMVAAPVRERIRQTAERLGYEPNRAARELATGRTGLVGLLVPDITNPFFPPLVRAIEGAAAARGSGVLLVDTAGDPDAEPRLIGQLIAQVDGLVIASPRAAATDLIHAAGRTPAVVVNHDLPGLAGVVVDNGAALRAAVVHVADLGHRTIALVRGPATAWAAARRAEAVRSAAVERTLEVVEVGPVEAQFDDGRHAVAQLVARGATAVFAFDDLMACGVLAGLADHGLRCPADVSVIGCDDVLLARTVTPALTTITAPVDELGQRAVAMLDDVVAGGPVADARVTGELTLRGTTGPLAAPARH